MRLRVRERARLQAPFLLVLAIVTAAVIYLAFEPAHWRRGTGVIGLAMLLGAALRLVLHRRTAGLLAIRTKRLDALCFGLLGVVILIVDIRLHN